eukprot:scaffold181706_cov43-Prasinocladus_malaysianus.AAC.2
MKALDLHTELFSCPLTVSADTLSYHSETLLADKVSAKGPAFGFTCKTCALAVFDTDTSSQLRALRHAI